MQIHADIIHYISQSDKVVQEIIKEVSKLYDQLLKSQIVILSITAVAITSSFKKLPWVFLFFFFF